MSPVGARRALAVQTSPSSNGLARGSTGSVVPIAKTLSVETLRHKLDAAIDAVTAIRERLAEEEREELEERRRANLPANVVSIALGRK